MPIVLHRAVTDMMVTLLMYLNAVQWDGKPTVSAMSGVLYALYLHSIYFFSTHVTEKEKFSAIKYFNKVTTIIHKLIELKSFTECVITLI